MVVQMGDSIEAIERGLAAMGRIDQQALDNLEMMKHALVGVLIGDMDRYFAVFADDCVIHEPESLFYGGDHRGIEACKALGKNVVSKIYERCHFRVWEMGTGGDHVFVRYFNTFVFKDTFEELPMHILEIWKIKDKKVIECRPYIFDSHALVIRSEHMDHELLT